MATVTAGRLERVWTAASESEFAALLVCAPANIAYVSGFLATPHERLIALVVRPGEPLRAVVPALEREATAAALPAEAEVFAWGDDEGPASALAAALAGVEGAIGIEKSYLTVAFAELAAAVAPGVRFDDAGLVLSRLRAVKDDGELALHRRAAEVVDTAITAFRAAELRANRTERELAASLARLIEESGGEGLPFEPAVLTGARSALPHGHPDRTLVREGDLVIVDIGARVGGYCADITRTFVAGRKPATRQRELHALVDAARTAGIAAARAGQPASSIDDAARKVIESAGLGERFIHRTGHGLGLELHEAPSLTATNHEPLRPSMVVTVEPGVYLEGYGGIRLEDDVVITEAEPEVLTAAPLTL